MGRLGGVIGLKDICSFDRRFGKASLTLEA
jgi:hypothetical protein